MTRLKSKKIYDHSCTVIPLGVNSPTRAFPTLGITPLVAESGAGDMITDADGYRYIDYCQAWGSLIHGHCHPKIVKAAQEQIALGSGFGITTEIEATLAQKIIDLMPSIEKIRFVSTGTEACMTVARLARGFTGRDIIIKFTGHYHGHADCFLVQAGSAVSRISTSSSAGIPAAVVANTIALPFNDIEKVRAVLRDPAISLNIAQ